MELLIFSNLFRNGILRKKVGKIISDQVLDSIYPILDTTTLGKSSSSLISCNPGKIILDECSNGVQRSQLLLTNYFGNGQFAYRCENCVAEMSGIYDELQNVINLRISFASYNENPVLLVDSPSCESCTFPPIPIAIDDKLCSTPQIESFKKSLTASYMQKYMFDYVKMQFQTKYRSEISFESAQEKVADACYNAITDENLIDCKIIMAKDLTLNARQKRSVENESLYYVIAVAKFPNKLSKQEKSVIQSVVQAGIEEDGDAQEIIQFITPGDDIVSFILQITFLGISITTAIFATAIRIQTYRYANYMFECPNRVVSEINVHEPTGAQRYYTF